MPRANPRLSAEMNVFVYSWKPATSINFGDEIGPMVVQALCRNFQLNYDVIPTVLSTHSKILAIGSVLHEAKDQDVVWGVGVNSKHRSILPRNANIRFAAVRGPLTRFMMRDQGFNCPEIYGDPGLLFPMLFDEQIRARRGELEKAAREIGVPMPETIVIPNINDDRFLPYFTAPFKDNLMFIRPNLDPFTVAAYISASKRVISSSLHGLVFADVYGKAITRMASQFEADFKYTDYYEGTDRTAPRAYRDLKSSLDGELVAPLAWNPEPLLRAFPLLDPALQSRLAVKIFEVDQNRRYEVNELPLGTGPFTMGWAKPDGGAIWSIDEWADFEMLFKTRPQGNMILRLNVGTLDKGVGAFVVFRVVHGGKVIDSHRIVRNEASGPIDISLPPVDKSGEMSLRFKIENASRPADHGMGDDVRHLGVWISSFEILSGS
ncbi:MULTISPECIES: polysaccharide pyruvyl transferase family protein [unclassified Sphingobium]|uniref:polysaccharide pyruvyl transferase family protein n=1 Tax=unclassified Sphingobium TaxID=2611147 RepID=UPI0015E64339|nr:MULTISPECIES: polysaccharide pyruvyl transferase family protein [unclassified Sphingobium]